MPVVIDPNKTWVPLGIAVSGGVVLVAVGIAWGNLSTKVLNLSETVSDIKVQVSEIRSILDRGRPFARENSESITPAE